MGLEVFGCVQEIPLDRIIKLVLGFEVVIQLVEVEADEAAIGVLACGAPEQRVDGIKALGNPSRAALELGIERVQVVLGP